MKAYSIYSVLILSMPLFAMHQETEAEKAIREIRALRSQGAGVSYLERLPAEILTQIPQLVVDEEKKFYEFLPTQLRPVIQKSVRGKSILELPEFAKRNVLTQIIANFPKDENDAAFIETINNVLGLYSFSKIAASPAVMDELISLIYHQRRETTNEPMIAAHLTNSAGALEWLKKGIQKNPQVKKAARINYQRLLTSFEPDQTILNRYIKAGVLDPLPNRGNR